VLLHNASVYVCPILLVLRTTLTTIKKTKAERSRYCQLNTVNNTVNPYYRVQRQWLFFANSAYASQVHPGPFPLMNCANFAGRHFQLYRTNNQSKDKRSSAYRRSQFRAQRWTIDCAKGGTSQQAAASIRVRRTYPFRNSKRSFPLRCALEDDEGP
jgi:hypothetical protein